MGTLGVSTRRETYNEQTMVVPDGQRRYLGFRESCHRSGRSAHLKSCRPGWSRQTDYRIKLNRIVKVLDFVQCGVPKGLRKNGFSRHDSWLPLEKVKMDLEARRTALWR